jgi:hypothetical protein
MFTIPETRLFPSSYFQVIRKTDDYIEIKSLCSGHCWVIRKIPNSNLSISLYHKHSSSDMYYHPHPKYHTVKDAVEAIYEHDSFVIGE